MVLIIFALIAASQAAVLLHHPAAISTGGSTQYRSQDNYGNYNFGYDEGHLSGGTFRKEAGDAYGNVAGSYGLRDADGRIRIVNYVADAAGFRADIKTNEPGVEPKDPAHTAINKAGVAIAPAAPAIAYAAPAAPALAYAAPAAPALAYAAPAAPALAYAAPALPVASAPVAYSAPAPIAYAAPHYGYAYHY
ncbi:cuticle protein 14 isoform b [Trichonephila inaurata madagascariensis]|uniref:Cuticle protein 14 isoform b n=1 Tax=Trichonephila inaurata madagascariensis TaxID=2747483 RepID=A0A8X7BZG5_9ARAC|nr:cuticle protein 14 isoform b [Trichonephila inaurata madagascariensis]